MTVEPPRIPRQLPETFSAPKIAPVNIDGWIAPSMPAIPHVMIPATLTPNMFPVPGMQIDTMSPDLPQQKPFSTAPEVIERTEKLASIRNINNESTVIKETSDIGIKSVLEAILTSLEGLKDRPIDISVTTNIDGRQVAETVYRDLRERKIRNYETL